MLTYLITERPWAPTSVRASEPTLVSTVPSGDASVHVSPAFGVSVSGVSGVEGAPVVRRQLAMQPLRIQTLGITGFATAAKDNPTASKRVDGASGVPPRGRPV